MEVSSINRIWLVLLCTIAFTTNDFFGQDRIVGDRSSERALIPNHFSITDRSEFSSESLKTRGFAFNGEPQIRHFDVENIFIQSQSPGGTGSALATGSEAGGASSAGAASGAGAADATDPSAILMQLQLQNLFTPETYDATGYSNTLIIQPVLPFPVETSLLKEFFPNHILRPTLPIIAPTADPDGPFGVQGGLGDLTLLDVFIHQVEGFGTVGLGYTSIFPTATDSQLGLREWQFGPAALVFYKQIPKTLIGGIYQQAFSLDSDAQKVLITPVLIRHLPDQWYVGWGDLNWEFNTETGGYNIPLSTRIGKICKIGDLPVNVFLQPFYTPEGLRSGPASEWGVKLNVTFLFPDLKFGPLF